MAEPASGKTFTSTPLPTNTKRIAPLDGLRGIAVLLVLAAHILEFKEGWIGVDVFFVLSGFLITTILRSERNEPNFWKMFYTRRVARIAPPFIALLVLAPLLGRIPLSQLWPYLIGCLVAASNFVTWHHESLMWNAGLSILWSLAIEEQFYAIWPIQVRLYQRRTLVWILVIIICIEPMFRVVATLNGVSWLGVYLLTPFRLDGLALGACLALAMEHPDQRAAMSRRVSLLLFIGSLALAIVFPLLSYKSHAVFCGAVGFSLIALVTTVAIAHLLLRPESFLAKVISWKPLVFLGRISYGLYMYHVLILTIIFRVALAKAMHHGQSISLSTRESYVVLFIVTFVLILVAWLSFKYFESPFLAWGRARIGAYRAEVTAVRQLAD